MCRNTGKGGGGDAENFGGCKVSEIPAKQGFSSWPLRNDVCHGHKSCFFKKRSYRSSTMPCYITDRARFQENTHQFYILLQCTTASSLRRNTPQLRRNSQRRFPAALKSLTSPQHGEEDSLEHTAELTVPHWLRSCRTVLRQLDEGGLKLAPGSLQTVPEANGDEIWYKVT